MTEHFKNLDIKKLLKDLAYLKIEPSYIEKSESNSFDETIDHLYGEGCSNLIIDVSDVEYLNSEYVSILLKKFKMLKMWGGSLRLVVMEDKPRLKFSVNDSVSELDLFLSKENAIEDYFD